MKVITTEKVPIKMWLDDIDEGALDQAKNLANLPFIHKHVAIMPDSHLGYGMPIGGVIATKSAIIPNAVGVDIGCGMCAVRTDLKNIKLSLLTEIVEEIKETIPVGFKSHPIAQDESDMPDIYCGLNSGNIVYANREKAYYQLGTLGGGNHFIEIQKGSDGFIWIMIHSGSRNVGKQVADHYNKLAVELNSRWHSQVPKEWQLAFLPTSSKECDGYFHEMWWCVNYAFANRKHMMRQINKIISSKCKNSQYGELINIAHNYAGAEIHFGERVMVHRKGATQAKVDQLGIIPGSQGTSSYIVKGKGNKDSFNSCSHGAGRVLGRRQAKRELNLEDESKKMKGIVHDILEHDTLDEAPGAYKDINTVMENQKDLVDIVVELKPFAVIKG